MIILYNFKISFSYNGLIGCCHSKQNDKCIGFCVVFFCVYVNIFYGTKNELVLNFEGDFW